MRKNTLGILLIAIGVLLLLNQFLSLSFPFWPLFLLIPGLALALTVNKNAPGLLIPSTILILLGIFFYFEEVTHWNFSDKTWPTYILIVGMAFIITYLYSRDRGFLIPGSILLFIAFVFYFFVFSDLLLWPILLIVGGILMIINFKGTGIEKKFNELTNKEEKENRE